MKLTLRALAILIWLGLPICNSLTVYDCDDKTTQLQTLDLLHVGECARSKSSYDKPRNLAAQIVDSGAEIPVVAKQCRIIRTTKVFVCWFDSITYGGMRTTRWLETTEISKQDCEKTQATGQLSFGGQTLEVALDGEPRSFQFYSKGGVASNGRCNTEDFEVNGNVHRDHVEETVLTVLMDTVHGRANPHMNSVYFPTLGLKHAYRDGYLMDHHAGALSWATEEPNCQDTTMDIYAGNMTLHPIRNSTDLEGSIVMLENLRTDQFAGLVLKDSHRVCGVTCFSTQVPNLSVCPYHDGRPMLPDLGHVSTDDPFETNILSEVSYLHLSAGMDVDIRFAHAHAAACDNERRALQGRLQAIQGGSDPGALRELYGPGHQAVIRGSGGYISKCAPKEAVFEQQVNCTREIPVRINGTDPASEPPRYADPVTLILQDIPTILPCAELMPVRWFIKGQWMCTDPQLYECETKPQQLTPSATPAPSFDHALGLGSGIYTEEQFQRARQANRIDGLRNALMTNDGTEIAGSVIINPQGGWKHRPSLEHLDMEVLSYAVGSWLLPGYGLLGHLWSAAVWFFIAFFLLKAIVTTATRAYKIFQVKGFGWWLCGAVTDLTFDILLAPKRLAETAVDMALKKGYDDTLAREEEAAAAAAAEEGRAYGGGNLVSTQPRSSWPSASMEADTAYESEPSGGAKKKKKRFASRIKDKFSKGYRWSGTGHGPTKDYSSSSQLELTTTGVEYRHRNRSKADEEETKSLLSATAPPGREELADDEASLYTGGHESTSGGADAK